MPNEFVQFQDETVSTGTFPHSTYTFAPGALATQELTTPEGSDEALTGETI